LKLGSLDDSLELLMKAYDMAKSVFEENDNRCAGILTLVSNCFGQMKEYDKALEYMEKVWIISE